LIGGCETDIYLQSKSTSLTIAFSGGREHPPTLFVTGGHVYALVLHSRRNDLGVFDCL
jgi:hypothetical protein